MAAGTVLMYDFVAKYLLGGSIDLNTDTVKLALVTSSYTPDQVNHDLWADVSANEITGGGTTGYTTGGYTLLTPVFTAVTKGFKFSSANPSWTAGASTLGTWKYGVLYVSGTVDTYVNPLIGYFEGESGSTVPATTDTNTLTITVPAGGWFDITRP